jgi:MYXO-CTERM domain-containing protein
VAHAGDVKFGTEPLEVNDAGKLTDAGKKAATETLKSMPGEEVWPIHVWAQIDNGGPGPLYVEFWGKLPDGKPYLTFRHEHSAYGGEKYVSISFELSGNLGFNKGKTYNVKVLQVSPKGKDLVLANGKVTLAYTEPEKEPEGDEEGDEEGKDDEGEENDTAEQDAIDTLTPGAEGGGAEGGPPPVDSKGKKGCSIGSEDAGLSLALLMFAAGALRLRRRTPSR